MASKRDLVEAHAFNRRRLVTAFLGGAPGGRELEPARPARAVIAGVVLAALLVVGAAVSGFLRPGLPNGWNNNTLVIGRDTGARYVATGGVLYPVANTTSARLLLPAEDFKVVLAPDDKIAREPRGTSIGIVGAPDALPEPKDLVQSGWTDCLDNRGRTRLRIATAPGASPVASNVGLLVQSGQDLQLISGGFRFRITPAARVATLRALGLDAATPVQAPATWTELFPAGPDLAPLTFAGAGAPLPAGAPAPGGATRLGTVVLVSDAAGPERPYVLTATGLAPLTPVGAALYQVGTGGQLGSPVRVTQADVASLPTTERELVPPQWPDQLPRQLSSAVACAQLTTGVDQLPRVALATPVAADALPGGTGEVVVEPAHGAVVRSIAGGVVNRGTVFVADSSGRRYALGGAVDNDLARLGYGRTVPAPVPLAWVDLLRDGPELSPQAAQQIVSSPTAPGS